MTNLETVAAQRDELSMKLRDAIRQRDAALAEVARLKGAPPLEIRQPRNVDGSEFVPEVPAVTPPKSKRPGIFGGKP